LFKHSNKIFKLNNRLSEIKKQLHLKASEQSSPHMKKFYTSQDKKY